MPTIHKMFLLKLVAALALCAGAVAGVHTVQAHRIPAALERQAERAAEAGKPDAAIHYLRQYLEFRPDDIDAQERLAGLMRGRPNRNAGDQLLLYDKILRNDPTRQEVRREALAASLRIGRYTDAETHARELLKVYPREADLHQKLATALAAMQKSDDARRSYEAAIQADPANVSSYQRYAQFLWRETKSAAEAKAVIDRLIAALPHEAESYLTRARFDNGLGDGATVAGDLARALDLDPENAEALLLLAETYQKQRLLNEARDCLANGAKLYPGDLRMIRSLAWLDLNMGNIGAAVAVLEDGMARVSDGFELLVPLADLLVQLGETARTEEIVRKLQAKPTREAKMQTKYLQARLQMRASRWAEAIELLTGLRNDAITIAMPGLESQSSLLLAACHQRRGDTAAEQETLKLLLNKDPNHLAGRVGLAQSYVNAGRTAEGVAEFEAAAKSPYASPAVHASLVRLKMLDYARNGARPMEWAQLDRVAGELAKISANTSSEPTILRAEVLEARGELKQATAALKAEASRRPGDVRLWSALADRVAKFAGVSAAFGILDEAQAAAGDGADLRLARADLAARDPARLRPIEPLAQQIDTWPEGEQTKLLFGLVEVYDRLGDDAGVLKTYKLLTNRRPNDLTLWETAGERAARHGDRAGHDEALAAARRIDPTGKSAALLAGWGAAYAKAGVDVPAADEKLVQAFGANPERADACLARASLKLLQNDVAGAGALLERAVRLEPGRFPPAQHYLAYLAQHRGEDSVNAVVLRLASDPRWLGLPLRRAIRGAVTRSTPDAGMRLLASARGVLEREPAGFGWLGDTYRLAGRSAEAAECFDRAVAQPGATADDWLRLAIRTAERSSPEAGVKVLEAARGKLPAPLFAGLQASFADCPAAPKGWEPTTADAQEKRLFTQSRLAVRLSRFQRAEAITMLDLYLTDAKLPEGDAAWAKRNLAMLLAFRGTPADRERAVALLTQAGDKGAETPDEKRATAAVLTALARHLDGEPRKSVTARAVKTLEDLVAETRSPGDAYLLAQVYRTTGNRRGAIEILNTLLADDRKNLDYHIMALEELADLGQLAAAEPFAQRLLALYPADFRAIAAVARFECRAGRAERALVLAEGYARTADATVGDLPAKSARVAELLDELVRLPSVRKTAAARRMTNSAVERYEALAVTRPETLVAAAGLLAHDGRPADAFALIEKHAKALPARTRANAGMTALRAGGASERQFATVKEWLAAARADEPTAMSLVLHEGEYHALRLDYAAAEACFSAVLAREPRNVVALNNLAWILAPNPASAAKALDLIDRAVAEVGLTGELLDTRARVRIAAKQFELAETDLLEALTREKTALRMFHMALAKQGQTPAKSRDASTAFRQAKERGLDAKAVHPADMPQYRAFEAETPRDPG